MSGRRRRARKKIVRGLQPKTNARSRRHTVRPAVFLDRDGTFCEEVGYVNHLDRVRLYPWAAEAIRKLNNAGLPVIVVTNQSGVGRGYFREALVRQAHEKIARDLGAAGARVEAFYYCPHHPNAPVEAYRVECVCRKPATGLVEKATRRFRIDVKSSYVVGDSYRDMRLGFNAGARTILVLTGYGRGEYEHQRGTWPREPDWVVENLLEAVEKILAESPGRAVAPSHTATRAAHL